jgi:teichuronic acid biosynthesis glycosyltransferase TuaC
MKILYITNMFPVADYIYFGIHVKEQIDDLQNVADIDKTVYFINGRDNKWNYFKSIQEIKNIIKNENFDLIHVHYGISALFLLFYKPSIPVVVTLHSGELFQKKGYINHFFQKNITLAVVERSDKVIVLNDDMVSLLSKYKKKLVKQPCGTNLISFKEITIERDPKKFFVGFPGNKARKEKNHFLFSSIIEQLKTSVDIEVIEFHNMTREEVLLNLNKIDLLLMTSTVEGSPQIIKEALACNKPIISTAVGDVEYLLKDVVNCSVVTSFDVKDFIAPISKIIALPVRDRRSDGRESLLNKKLDSESVARSVYKLYNELV